MRRLPRIGGRAGGRKSHRRMTSGDPSKGIPYNEIKENRGVSNYIWLADVARTPQILKTLEDPVDVQGKARQVNSHRPYADAWAFKFKGN